jgi:hypothetical protein
MNLPRHTRAAAFAAALSAALVVGMTGTALAFDDLNCNDFTYQDDARAVLDGVTCEALPHRPAGTAAATEDKTEDQPQTTPQAASAELSSNAARECPDFATRADARGAAVYPVGGAVTGGTPAP